MPSVKVMLSVKQRVHTFLLLPLPLGGGLSESESGLLLFLVTGSSSTTAGACTCHLTLTSDLVNTEARHMHAEREALQWLVATYGQPNPIGVGEWVE